MMSTARTPITFTVETLLFTNMQRRAQAMGLKTVDYARRLFEAAYAARIGREKQHPVTDAELDVQVRIIMCLVGEFDPRAIAKATGLSEGLVENVLRGFRQVAAEPPAAPKPLPQSEPAQKAGARAGYSHAEIETIRAMWADGKSIADIAKAVGRPAQGLSVWAGKHRDICPKRRGAGQ